MPIVHAGPWLARRLEGGVKPAVEELLERLTRADRRPAVWCACECARTVVHLLPEDERPRLALETALADGALLFHA